MNFYRASIIVPLLVLVADVLMAAGPLDPNLGAAGNVYFEKQLNGNTDYPLSLFKTTSAAHNATPANPKFFTARVISRLDGEGIPASDQAAVRNEICASLIIQSSNLGQNFNRLPGAIGFFRYQDAVVAIHDVGLAGEPLSDVLSGLARVTDHNIKDNYASKYANDLIRLLGMVHRANIIWNVDSLSNFYVQPDGTLMGIDFSRAKRDALPAVIDSPAKIKERKDFLAQVIFPMYQLLFPPAGEPGGVRGIEAYTNFYTDLLLLGGANWRSTAANFTDVNFLNFGNALVAPMPYLPPIGVLATVNRVDHTSAQPILANAGFLGNNGFAIDNGVLQLVLNPSAPAPFSRLIGLGVAGETSMCQGWTGN